jgi:glutathione S-transferase
VKSLLDSVDFKYEAKQLDLLGGEAKKPEYLAINPNGNIPFLTYDGKAMWESASMLRYLACKIPALNKYYPANLEKRQEIDAALDFNGTTFRPGMLYKIVPNIIKGRTGGFLPPLFQAQLDTWETKTH